MRGGEPLPPPPNYGSTVVQDNKERKGEALTRKIVANENFREYARHNFRAKDEYRDLLKTIVQRVGDGGRYGATQGTRVKAQAEITWLLNTEEGRYWPDLPPSISQRIGEKFSKFFEKD